MTKKLHIIQELGESSLLLPTLLADALAANDRLKLALTLLQDAAAHASQPGRTMDSLAAERRAVGLTDPQFDATIVGARALAADCFHVPGARALLAAVVQDLEIMLSPLRAAGSPEFDLLDQRRTALIGALPAGECDEIAPRDIQALSSARHEGPDSLHLLIMEAHKAINALAARAALEDLDGARVQSVEAEDRPRIKAFMRGLRRTSGLAFGHPGLATTAARSGKRLIIQNDIGETDAHVVVIHVEDRVVVITYTDVHSWRTRFFRSMFEGRNIDWGPIAEKEALGLSEASFYLVTGRYIAEDEDALRRFLDHLGSRLVFLIDWNKARKSLRSFVGKQEAFDMLSWSAAHDYGHRAFLELGGADLVFEAIRRAGPGRIPYGKRLDATLGTASCVRFLQRVLRQSSEGLRAGRSQRLIRDEIQADLAQLFETAEFSVLSLMVRHLGVMRTLASAIADHLGGPDATAGERARLARRAKLIEEKADRVTLQAREICTRIQGGGTLRLAVDEVENATDALDEAAYRWSLFPPGVPQPNRALTTLADIVLESIGQLVRATEAASRLPQGNRLDSAASLQAIDAVTLAERRADAAERSAIGTLMSVPAADARALVLSLEVTRALESATDHLAHAALALRERVLEELTR